MSTNDRFGVASFKAGVLPSAGWQVPEGLRVDGDSLAWDPVGSVIARPRLVEPAPSVLADFVGLATVPAAARGAAVLEFARAWGVLSRCTYHPDGRHPLATEFVGSEARAWLPSGGDASEPLAIWVIVAERYRALLALASNLRAGGVGSSTDWAAALAQAFATIDEIDEREVTALKAMGTEPPSLAETSEGRRRWLAAGLSAFLRTEHVYPLMGVDRGKFVAGYGVGGLSGALALSAYLVVLGGKKGSCADCGAPVAARVLPPLCDKHRRSARERDRRARRRYEMSADQRRAFNRSEADRKARERAR